MAMFAAQYTRRARPLDGHALLSTGPSGGGLQDNLLQVLYAVSKLLENVDGFE